jgi:hypothetical protein
LKRIHGAIFMLFCFAVCLTPTGPRAAGDRIVFLNIRMVKGELTLESIEVVDGRLKTPRTLHLAKGISGNPIFETVVLDPSIQRLEYADDEGRLHSKVVTREDAFFSIRIPYDVAARTVEIYRIEAPSSSTELLKKARRIGSLTIDLSGGGHE